VGLIPDIDSVEALELLLLLRRSPETFWTAEAAAQQLGMTPDLADRKLSRLVDAQVLVRGRETGAYRFAPATDAARTLIDKLVALYDQQRMEKLRAFSNAFRLKNE
jgi:hypothetical protein